MIHVLCWWSSLLREWYAFEVAGDRRALEAKASALRRASDNLRLLDRVEYRVIEAASEQRSDVRAALAALGQPDIH